MAYTPNTQTLTVGGYVFTDLTNLIVLWTSTNANNATFRKPNTTAGYQVPVGKTFKAYALKAVSRSAVSADIYLGYSDNDVGINAATGLTNAVYVYNNTTNGVVHTTSTTSGSSVEEYLGPFSVPAQKYISIFTTSGNATYQIFGYEV